MHGEIVYISKYYVFIHVFMYSYNNNNYYYCLVSCISCISIQIIIINNNKVHRYTHDRHTHRCTDTHRHTQAHTHTRNTDIPTDTRHTYTQKWSFYKYRKLIIIATRILYTNFFPQFSHIHIVPQIRSIVVQNCVYVGVDLFPSHNMRWRERGMLNVGDFY